MKPPGSAIETAYDELRHVRLPNWGRWTRRSTGGPDASACSRALYAQMMGGDDEDEGYGSVAAPDAIVPIDYLDAERLDVWIIQLRRTPHLATIKAAFHLGWDIDRVERLARARRGLHPPTEADIAAAVRALMDLMAQNRSVVKRMRALGA